MNLKMLKEQVLVANLDLPRHGLVTFTWGNVSGIDRERNLVVIKPSGVSYERMRVEDMVVLDLAGKQVEGSLRPSADTAVRRERREMLANLAAYTSADPSKLNDYVARRDREMFANFQRWMARWPAGTKVIVWTATAHAARAPHRFKGFEGVQPFGAYLARRYGKRMFALGFAAQGGTTRGRPSPLAIAAPAPDSLEVFAGPIAPGGTLFLDYAALTGAGVRPGGLFSHVPNIADWSQLLDGVVVFPLEAAATDIRTSGWR